MFLGGAALRAERCVAASRVANATGAKVLAETFPARLERGAGLPAVERLAYLAEFAAHQLDGLRHLVLVDAKAPVSFFAYPGKASYLVPDGCEVHVLADAGRRRRPAHWRRWPRRWAPRPTAPPASRPSGPTLPTGDLTAQSGGPGAWRRCCPSGPSCPTRATRPACSPRASPPEPPATTG